MLEDRGTAGAHPATLRKLTPAEIPAGRVSSTLKLGGERVEQISDAPRNGAPMRTDYDRRTVSLQGDIDVPLASRAHEVLPVLGELTASVNAGYNLETFKDRLALGAAQRHTLLRQGYMLYQLIPTMPEHKLLPMLERFAAKLREQPVFTVMFGGGAANFAILEIRIAD